ncbi:Hypothetical protein SCLAV_0156 [Streptomyces clavuligerus]|uniref:Uncharacterized protein n=1 Tax=Streptomyces clavuligerus TaxID=1901 RepID=E2Q6Y5_STRCL|nr:Hypothetical protein SCLAV_0156 [Streptomyces clavuligerus]
MTARPDPVGGIPVVLPPGFPLREPIARSTAARTR